MSQPKALIVDDEPDIRELLGITLSRMELDVRTAANLDEAYRQLEASPPDICLTDMRLPDGDGIELVRQLSEQHGGRIPVAVITAHGDMNSAVDALKAGAFD
ncbi:MAG: response regulator, partial [Gammaproteobacteria bacterium]|nr:response regulator [Gammaproteobacteria bacterium]